MTQIVTWDQLAEALPETETLFLDRDGVINKMIPNDYVKSVSEFVFLDGVLEALPLLSVCFKHIIVVTNQAGIGKGLMTQEDLKKIHDYMLDRITGSGGRIDLVLHCPDRDLSHSTCRKPHSGMAIEAQNQYQEIVFSRSLMVGDNITDMLFAEGLGMQKLFIGNHPEYLCFKSLENAARWIYNIKQGN